MKFLFKFLFIFFVYLESLSFAAETPPPSVESLFPSPSKPLSPGAFQAMIEEVQKRMASDQYKEGRRILENYQKMYYGAVNNQETQGSSRLY